MQDKKVGFGQRGVFAKENLSQQADMLGGVIKIQDEFGHGKTHSGLFPHPGRAIAQEDHERGQAQTLADGQLT